MSLSMTALWDNVKTYIDTRVNKAQNTFKDIFDEYGVKNVTTNIDAIKTIGDIKDSIVNVDANKDNIDKVGDNIDSVVSTGSNIDKVVNVSNMSEQISNLDKIKDDIVNVGDDFKDVKENVIIVQQMLNIDLAYTSVDEDNAHLLLSVKDGEVCSYRINDEGHLIATL